MGFDLLEISEYLTSHSSETSECKCVSVTDPSFTFTSKIS